MKKNELENHSEKKETFVQKVFAIKNEQGNILSRMAKIEITRKKIDSSKFNLDNVRHLNFLTYEKRKNRFYLLLLIVLSPLTVFVSLFFVNLFKDKVKEKDDQIKSLLTTLKEIYEEKNTQKRKK